MGKFYWRTDKQYIFSIYAVLFLVLGIWKLVPYLLSQYNVNLIAPGGPSSAMALPFAVLCFVASVGIFLRHSIFGHKLGSAIIIYMIAYLFSGVAMGTRQLSPVTVFLACNFVVLLATFGFAMAQSFTSTPLGLRAKSVQPRRSIQPTLS